MVFAQPHLSFLKGLMPQCLEGYPCTICLYSVFLHAFLEENSQDVTHYSKSTLFYYQKSCFHAFANLISTNSKCLRQLRKIRGAESCELLTVEVDPEFMQVHFCFFNFFIFQFQVVFVGFSSNFNDSR